MLGGEDRGRVWRGIGWAGSGGGASAAARSDRKGELWCVRDSVGGTDTKSVEEGV